MPAHDTGEALMVRASRVSVQQRRLTSGAKTLTVQRRAKKNPQEAAGCTRGSPCQIGVVGTVVPPETGIN